MLKIETDYNADKAECLINILNHGIYSTCFKCANKGDIDCPFYDIVKVKKEILKFITNVRYIEKEVQE